MFLAKYNSSGTNLWTKQFGSDQFDDVASIAIDGSDNIYISGSTGGDFDGHTFVSGGSHDYYLIKFDSSGNKQWSKLFGDNTEDQAKGLTTDSSGNIYITGYTSGGLGGFSNLGQTDYFLQKLNSSGDQIWFKQFGTSKNDHAYGVTADSSGNIIITGWTTGAFEGYTNAGSWDIFVIKYDSDGNIQ